MKNKSVHDQIYITKSACLCPGSNGKSPRIWCSQHQHTQSLCNYQALSSPRQEQGLNSPFCPRTRPRGWKAQMARGRCKTESQLSGTVGSQGHHLCLRQPPPTPQGSPASQRSISVPRPGNQQKLVGIQSPGLPAVLPKSKIKTR